MNEFPFLNVYTAFMPDYNESGTVFSCARQCEIDAIKNETVRKEKYYVWKLLEFAVNNSLSIDPSRVNFYKKDTGKWSCRECEFSLSHTDGLVCVAVSSSPVGVDVEKIKPLKVNVAKKVLSDEEMIIYSSLTSEQKTNFLISAWTKKESWFKEKNIKNITVDEFRNQTGTVFQTIITRENIRYSIAVASPLINAIKLHENIKL